MEQLKVRTKKRHVTFNEYKDNLRVNYLTLPPSIEPGLWYAGEQEIFYDGSPIATIVSDRKPDTDGQVVFGMSLRSPIDQHNRAIGRVKAFGKYLSFEKRKYTPVVTENVWLSLIAAHVDKKYEIDGFLLCGKVPADKLKEFVVSFKQGKFYQAFSALDLGTEIIEEV